MLLLSGKCMTVPTRNLLLRLFPLLPCHAQLVAQALRIFGLGWKNNYQLSLELTIKKEFDTISQYLHKIIEARDYLSAAEVYFADEDIVILALNGMPHECNTFRCVVRVCENVITLKDDGQPYGNPALYRTIVGALQ